MSNAVLVFQVADPQAAHTFYDQIIKFVGVGAAASEGDAFAAVDGLSLAHPFLRKYRRAFFDLLRDFAISLIPGNIFPVGCPRTPHLRLEQATLIQYVLGER